MKQKTSVSIDGKILAVLKREAKRQDRSVSYILEKFIEGKVREIVAAQAAIKKPPRGVRPRMVRCANNLLANK
jgi:hypothetical protein